jgi:thiamine transporter 2/3
MHSYLKVSLLLSALGFLKEFRPIESFIVDYYQSNFKDVTLEMVNKEIFPISTYSYTIQLIIIFLITDYLRYKPLIIVMGVSSCAIWASTLYLANGKLSLQIIEMVYGLFSAAEVAYFSYIYAKTDKEHYQVVTSHTRSAILFGRFFASVCAQLLVYFDISDYRQLNFITFIGKHFQCRK